jgi:hypothetical protein
MSNGGGSRAARAGSGSAFECYVHLHDPRHRGNYSKEQGEDEDNDCYPECCPGFLIPSVEIPLFHSFRCCVVINSLDLRQPRSPVDVVTQFPRGREPGLNVHIVLFANTPGSFRVVLIDFRKKEGDGVPRLGKESSRKEISESIVLVYSGSCERSAMPEAMAYLPCFCICQ